MQASDNTFYLRQETRMFVDEGQNPNEIFEHAADSLNSRPYEKFTDSTAAKKTISYNPGHYLFKVTVSKESADSPKIRISDIHGLFYSTYNGEVKYIENPTKGK